MHTQREAGLLLAETAASVGSTAERGRTMLELLRRVVPFDGAFLAFADPLDDRYHTLVTVDLDGRTADFLAGPQLAEDIEVTGTDRERPPLSPSDLPYPAEELPTWAEGLIPAGIREGLGVALFAPGQRHVGHLAVLSASPQPPSPATRRRLGQLAPVLARGVDPVRSLVGAARLVRGAWAGLVLLADGACRELPGLPANDVLRPDSPLVATARERAGAGQVCASFLWPLGGAHALDGHVRVTVLTPPEDVALGLTAMVLLSPPPDLRGLTPRELEVLGFLVEGCSNPEIAAALVVAPRTVAAHLEHILHKLGTPTRTLAAVRAEREGVYVPAVHHRQRALPDTAAWV